VVLERVASKVQQQAARGRIHPASFGIKPENNTNRRQSCSPDKDGSTTAKIGSRTCFAKTVFDIAVKTP